MWPKSQQPALHACSKASVLIAFQLGVELGMAALIDSMKLSLPRTLQGPWSQRAAGSSSAWAASMDSASQRSIYFCFEAMLVPNNRHLLRKMPAARIAMKTSRQCGGEEGGEGGLRITLFEAAPAGGLLPYLLDQTPFLLPQAGTGAMLPSGGEGGSG